MSRGVGIALSSLDDAHYAHRKALNMDDSDEMAERIAEVRQLYLDTLAAWPVGELPDHAVYRNGKGRR